MYGGLHRIIQKNITTAKYRRIFFDIRETDGISPFTGAVAGIKAKLSFNGAAEVDSTADIVRVTAGGALCYVELTQAEANTETGFVAARIPEDGGTTRGEATSSAEIVDYDPFQAGATLAEISDGVWDEPRAGHVTVGTFGEGVPVISLPDNIITAAKVAANAIGASQLAADAAAKVMTAVFAASFGANYSNKTFSEVIKIIVSVLAGKASGLDTTSASFLNLAGNAVVVNATVDADGNRDTVVLNP